MGHEIDLKRYDIRTDLVLDTIENNSSDIEKQISNYDSVKVTKVMIDSVSSKLLNKKELREAIFRNSFLFSGIPYEVFFYNTKIAPTIYSK